MAKNSQTFNASIRLNTSQFKKGINEVQKSLKSLQRSFLSVAGALGLGLSFQRLGSSLLDTATKLSTAKNVLENVSKEVGEYGQNLEWLRRISNEYGQDMVTLINSFAQFRAAASTSKLSLEQMRDIYESLTRAAGAFHLSSERTNDMMMAVTQMMSKGKVAAEELRRQLGNVLPGAFNLMAQAAYNAGIITENSTAALEDAMKKGKVIAEQVLPEFAKQLDVVTENANFESLQSSINRLKNSWTEMVDNGNFEGMYKGIIDEANKVVQYFSSGFWTKISSLIAGVFGGTVVAGGFKKFNAGVQEMRVAAEAEFNKIYKSADAVSDKLAKIYGNRPTRGAGIDMHSTRMPGGRRGVSFLQVNERDITNALSTDKILEAKKAVLEYNESLLKLNDAAKSAGSRGVFTNADISRIEKYNKSLKSSIGTMSGAGDYFGKLQKDASFANAAITKLGNSVKVLGGILKSALYSMAIGAVIAGITALIGKIIEARKEAKRLAGIADEMVDSVNKAGGENSKTLIQLTQIRKALQGIEGDSSKIGQKTALIGQVNKALGLTGDKLLNVEDDIKTKVIPAIDEYIKKIKETAKQQAILSLVQEKTSKVIQLEAENAAYTSDPNYGKTQTYNNWNPGGNFGGASMEVSTGLTKEAYKLQNKVDKNNKEIAALNEGIERIIKMADEGTLSALYSGSDTVEIVNNNTNSGGTETKKDTPQTVLNKYKEELKKLENQYKSGAILADNYKKKVEELNQKSFEELSAFGWDEAVRGLATGADKALAEELKKTATAKLLEGLDDPEAIAEFDKAMDEEADNALKKFQEAWKQFLDFKKKNPLFNKVDTSDDYMYSRKKGKGQSYSEYETHYNSEYLDAYQKYVDDLENYKEELQNAMNDMMDPVSLKRMNELLQQTIDKLELAKQSVKDLKTKANIAELEKDIADLKKEGLENIFSSITSIADGMDRLYRAVQSIRQINDETWKSEELEKFLTGLNAIIQAFEVMKSIIEAVNAVTQVYSKIKEKSAMKAIALNKLEAISEGEKASAAGAAAAAGAGSSVASIPFVGPALAVAAIASVVAALTIAVSKLHKFANGGIVDGSTTGDRNLIRVNGGEMVLNKQQQANLLALANGKGKGAGGSVDFRIRGTDLVGVLNNEMARRKG